MSPKAESGSVTAAATFLASWLLNRHDGKSSSLATVRREARHGIQKPGSQVAESPYSSLFSQ
jgi:hypothetical protein